jgi:hypothetical protein
LQELQQLAAGDSLCCFHFHLNSLPTFHSSNSSSTFHSSIFAFISIMFLNDFWRHGVSASALTREADAKELFLVAKESFDVSQARVLLKKGNKCTIQLLKPETHLTACTWKTFKEWLQATHPGWSAKRRQAVKKVDLKSCPSHGKGYFVDITYQDPSTIKPKKVSKAAKRKANDHDDDRKPAAKKRTLTNEYGEPAARLSRYHTEPFVFENGESCFLALPESLQTEVMSYVDVGTLGCSLACVSRKFHETAKHDYLWEHHLKFLLQTLFDGSIQDDAIPISQRPNWRESTEFRRWYHEDRDHAGGGGGGGARRVCIKYTVNGSTLDEVGDYESHLTEDFPGEGERFEWLLRDVSIRDYYKQAGAFAVQGVNDYYHMCRDNLLCPGCMLSIFHLQQGSCLCHRRGRRQDLVGRANEGGLEDMPRIELFTGVDRSWPILRMLLGLVLHQTIATVFPMH